MSNFNSRQMPDKFEHHLSTERFATYIKKTGDKESAFSLYVWNIAISSAFYGPLQAVEILLRNSLHNSLSTYYGSNWLDNTKIGLNENGCSKIEFAKRRLKNNGYEISTPNIVATLSLGFWVSLLTTGGKNLLPDIDLSYF